MGAIIKIWHFALVGLVTGCALTSRFDPLNSDGRLTKLSHMHKANLAKDENKRIGKIVQTEKKAMNMALRKSYKLPQVISEESFYSEVLSAYQIRDAEKLDFFTKEIERRFSRSIYTDNAVYLRGRLKLTSGLPGEALRDFEKVLSIYPTGNKRVSALFSKAVAYRKLQLYQYAEKILKDIKKTYPGSPEYFQVDLEEKLLKLDKES
ncbi:MAG: hypothetical protein A2Z20_03015 [Bdellovibrionales bacterium RBG_16_40_8]|nr:MAG: hypothetical protein A2Z20_03015 [Bdellovibrionales bacterium RBG_16_40_8]